MNHLNVPDIVCKNCGNVNDYTTQDRNGQKPAWCNLCGKYIMNIPHDDVRFYFGRYSQIPVHEVDDLPYLEWFVENIDPRKMKRRLRDAIEFRIKELKGAMA